MNGVPRIEDGQVKDPLEHARRGPVDPNDFHKPGGNGIYCHVKSSVFFYFCVWL
jgi:hypothetical protein